MKGNMSMEFIVRECCINDAEYIQELNCNEMNYDYSVENTKLKLKKLLMSDKDKIFVAVADNKVVGYIHANDYDVIYAPSMKNIMGIAVSSAYRRNGIGEELLRKIEEWAEASGAKGIRLVSGASRAGAHEFYRHMGYDSGKQQLNFKKYF